MDLSIFWAMGCRIPLRINNIDPIIRAVIIFHINVLRLFFRC
jgi:hypothetical protein